MSVLLTYDLKEKHEAVKNNMIGLGYSAEVIDRATNKKIYLPNTALFHEKKTPQEAINDLKTICLNVGLQQGIGLERAFAVSFNVSIRPTTSSFAVLKTLA
ncbi:MAG TPA: hypothetical protein VM802_06575 [Chitinophaga sp.]|uniref:hypothetical protein n=1 Tax=Chitinophaga sp. TaxID=1869181 RepID=UPI002CFD3BD6|nr:hypothetical protein [Chitinophaga sp.]HVI44513.1 hypothetical protein [Chitinophaga sp.]